MPEALIETEATPSLGPPIDVGELFQQHYTLVFRAAYRVTGSASDAEDVLQTVFLRLVRRDLDTAFLQNPEGYLHRSAVNAAVDLLRTRQGMSFVALEDVEPVLPDRSSLDPSRTHDSGEIRQWLRNTVARLSPRSAEIFSLKFFEGKSNSEIAGAIGTTENTIAVTVHRIRERIQKEFSAFMGGRL